MKRHADEPIETPIASLIDIVFLLIIFFVVTSAIDQEAVDESIKLAESRHMDPVDKRDPRTITINLKQLSDDRSQVNIGSIPLSHQALSAILTNTSKKHGDDVPVVIRADGDLSFSAVDDVMSVVTAAGLHRIRLAARDVGN